MTTHDFHKSLALSRDQEDAPWWRDVYEGAFPTLRGMVSVRDDGWAQRGGIDRVLTLACGRTITVDEKVRAENWPDILLEYWSDRDRKTPGWVAKDLACDFIAYAFIPSRTCYLIPFLSLRQAWRKNRLEWVGQYRRVEAQNRGYTTVSVAVPTAALLAGITDAMRINWPAEQVAFDLSGDVG